MTRIKRFSPSIFALDLAKPHASAHGDQGVAAGPVMASFQRMLGCESLHLALLVPSSSGEDPLGAANMVLWRSEPASFHVADGRCHSAISNKQPPESTQTTYRKDDTCHI